MLVRFRSKAAAPFIMLPAHARALLRVAGKTPDEALPPQGVFTRAQLATAITQLEAAIAAEPPEAEPAPDAPKPHPVDEPVSLARRAWPLLDMLRRAHAAGKEVMWELED